jgi:hypothetical protein
LAEKVARLLGDPNVKGARPVNPGRNAPQSDLPSVGGLAGDIAKAVLDAIWSAIGSSVEKAGLYLVLVIGAVWLIGRGIQREVGVNPVSQAAHAVKRGAQAAASVGAAA